MDHTLVLAAVGRHGRCLGKIRESGRETGGGWFGRGAAVEKGMREDERGVGL